jgi:phosphohistidine phosphatase
MKQIFILRHAKSSWDNRELADFDRPLSMRGENDAKKLNTFVKKKSFYIDKVLCSSAIRTKETFDLIADGFRSSIEDAIYSEDLYFGSVSNIIDTLRKLDEKNKSILIIGHNPTLFYLVEELANERIQKFTTCNLAVLNFGDEWKRLSKSKCKLKSLYRPKEIEI